MLDIPDFDDDHAAAPPRVSRGVDVSAPASPSVCDRPAHTEPEPGNHAQIGRLSPKATVHLVRLAFMFGTKVPAGSRRNKHTVAYLREAMLARFLVHIATDPAAFEAAADECDWTVQ